jgi:hypothetical protein
MSFHATDTQINAAAAAGAQMTGVQCDYTTPDGKAYLDAVFSQDALHWDDSRLARITRLRLLSDPGFPVWDVSYCYGETKDGHPCRVILPFDQLPKRNRARAIIEHAQRDGVYAKGLGIFDSISTLQ